MHLLLTGGGFENKGAEAMLQTTRTELGRRLADATCRVLCAGREHPLALQQGFEPVCWPRRPALFHHLVRASALAVKHPSLVPLLVQHRAGAMKAVEILADTDAVIDVSGYAFGQPWGLSVLRRALAIACVCKKRHLPVCFMPQAWGPFEDPRMARAVTQLHKTATCSYARDALSVQHLVAAGVDPNSIRQAPDIVFRFEAAPPADTASHLATTGMNADKPFVAMTPNMRMAEIEGELYAASMAAIARALTRQSIPVLLLPHERRWTGPVARRRDDHVLCADIHRRADHDQVFMIEANLSPAQLKAIIGRADMLVGSRYHSLVFALASKVPCLAVGWSHKYPELMGLLSQQSLAPDSAALRSGALPELALRLWGRRTEVRETIAGLLPAVLSQVDTVFDRISHLVQGATGCDA